MGLRRERRQKPVDQRPYVGDYGRRLEGPADFTTVAIAMVLLALAVGFVVGFLVFALMNLSTWLTARIWDDLGPALGVPWFSLAVCTFGGLLIGAWTHFTGDTVKPLEEVMAEFRATGSYRTNGAGKAVVSFLLPLVFGGSVGFEAGLTGLITAGCCWIRDKLKAAGLREASVADVTIAATFAAVFGTPFAGIVAGAESSPRDGDDDLSEPDVNDYNLRKTPKIVLYTSAAIGAFGGIGAFSQLFGAAAGLPRFDSIQGGAVDLLWAIPCLLVAYAMVWLYHGSRFGFSRLSARLGDGAAATIVKPVFAGVVMGALAMAFPLVLFPGEEQAHELMQTWPTWTAAALVATGLLKAVVTPMCLNMGWMGGSFFPSIFAGVACGYGIAAFTGADPMLAVTVVASAFLAGVTRKPLLSLAILILCFPIDGILWSGLAAIIGGSLPVARILLSESE